MAVDGLR